MKKLLFSASLLLLAGLAHSQNGLEKILVEKYYISDANDVAAASNPVPLGSVTYRIYADMKPGYKFQVAYGNTAHPLKITTSTTFFNNDAATAATPPVSKTNLKNNTTMVDSWLSVGGATSTTGSNGALGILKSSDNGANTVVNAESPKLLQSTNPLAGIPLKTQDGLLTTTSANPVQAVTFVGFTNETDVFLDGTADGPSFITTNGAWSALNGATGPDSTNAVLIAQITTNGSFHFELNIQIGTPTGGTENYVSANPTGAEISIPSLVYNACSQPAITANSTSKPTSICKGSSASFTANGDGVSYLWLNPKGDTISKNANVVVTPDSNSTYVVVTKSTLGCANWDSVKVTLKALPTANANSTSVSTFICNGSSASFTASGGTSYLWQNAKGDTVSQTAAVTVNPTSNKTYKVRVTSSIGCSAWDSVTVLVNPLLTAIATSVKSDVIVAVTGGTKAYTYSWSSGAVTSNDTLKNLPNGTYTVTVVDSKGCTVTATATVINTGVTRIAEAISGVHVYPNPISNQLIVEFVSNEETVIQLSNILGSKLYSTVAENRNGLVKETINASDLPPGIYFLSITGSETNQRSVNRIVKE